MLLLLLRLRLRRLLLRLLLLRRRRLRLRLPTPSGLSCAGACATLRHVQPEARRMRIALRRRASAA